MRMRNREQNSILLRYKSLSLLINTYNHWMRNKIRHFTYSTSVFIHAFISLLVVSFLVTSFARTRTYFSQCTCQLVISLRTWELVQATHSRCSEFYALFLFLALMRAIIDVFMRCRSSNMNLLNLHFTLQAHRGPKLVTRIFIKWYASFLQIKVFRKMKQNKNWSSCSGVKYLRHYVIILLQTSF